MILKLQRHFYKIKDGLSDGKYQLFEELKSLSNIILLAEDIPEQKRDLTKSIQISKTRLQKNTEKLRMKEKELNELNIDRDLLEKRPIIEILFQGLGKYQSDLKDIQENTIRLKEDSKKADDILKSIDPDLSFEKANKMISLRSNKKSITKSAKNWKNLKRIWK